MKVHELAKKLGLENKQVIEVAKKNGIEVKSYLSGITEEEGKMLERLLKGVFKKKSMENKKEKNEEPVIIRRAVIINDDEENKEEEKRKKENEKKRESAFSTEKAKKKDYNIVYRDKPSKPLTVSELFGIPKKESKKKVESEKEVETKLEEKIDSIKQEESKEEIKVEIQVNVEEKKEEVKEKEEIKEKTNDTLAKTQIQKENKYGSKESGFSNISNNSNTKFNNKPQKVNNNHNGSNDYRNNRPQNSRDFRNKGDRQYNTKSQNGDRKEFNKDGRFDNRNKKLDDRGIDKKIKNIMEIDMPAEKENVREYTNNKIKDKQKQNRIDESRNSNKKSSRRNDNEDYDFDKLNSLKKHNTLSNMFHEEGEMLDYYDLSTERGKRSKKKIKIENKQKQKIFKLTEITIPENITVKDLAMEMKITSSDVIKRLLNLGMMVTINNEIDFDTAFLVAAEFGITAVKKNIVTDEDKLIDETEDEDSDLMERPPVIVVMGHVDHGKTSLLDAIRHTNVIEGESGGITQHIGAYQVKINDRAITFLDTPGHEAFTSMRARGAQITDIAILVVAANDGVMPQTVEAIDHAKAANIPIIVAVNKMDLPDSNIDKVKQELMKYNIVPEEWGGDTIFVPISAKTGMGIDTLLEMVLLQADVLELKANPNKQAKGAVIEARLDKSKGPIASVLVQRGKLDVGDTIIVGSSIGRIRNMTNDKGKKVKSAGPSTPVEITGLSTVPQSGDIFYEVKDEKTAKHLIERRIRENREKELSKRTIITLDNVFTQMANENLKQLNLIVKADVQGSVEALRQSLTKLSNDEVKVSVIHASVGGVTETDVSLAQVSNAIIIAFNVRAEVLAKNRAEKEGVEINQYSVIYDAINDVEAAMKGMLDPVYKEVVIGTAEVRQTFKVSNVGTIAGSYVLTGKVSRNAGIRVIRDNIVIHDGKLVSLKRFKDDVKEVATGYECGLQIDKFDDLQEGDMLEVYIMEEVK
ncbi:MAG: translation initiation factor IF-2 [Clostridia bacterium]|nr:translation initiation factor IF-2 [Clostridia bacterium]